MSSPHRPARTRRIVVAALAASALALSACGSSSGSDDSGEASASRLRYAYAFAPVAALSPYSDDAVTSYGVGATETLAKLDRAGSPEASLATAWEQESPTTWRLTLRPDVSFQDGTAMTSQTVADSLNHAAEAKPLPRSLTGASISAAADGDAVVVTTAAPDPVLVQRLTSPELAILSPAAYEKDANQPTPAGTGTGPFEITDFDGASSATLEANDDYWDGEPALDGIDLTFVSEGDSRVSALRSGQVDLAQALPAGQLGSIDQDEIVAVPLPRTVSLHLTQSSAVFSDAGQREAAREAIAPLDIAGTIYDGKVDPAEGLFSSVSTWADDRPAPTYPQAAEPSGTPITLATFSDRPELPEAATAIADAWRKAGFDVKTVVREYNQMEDDYLTGTYDAVIMSRSYGQDTADPITYLQADFGCDGGYNISLYCDETVDGELSDAAALPDVDARNTAAVAVESTLLSTVVVVPLIHDRTQFGTVDGLTGLAEDPWERAVVTSKTTLR